MDYNEPKLYADGNLINCTITNYKPPRPVIQRIANKPLNGYSKFQIVGQCDTLITFTVVFNIETMDDVNAYKSFMSSYNKEFTFIDEWNKSYTGFLQGDWDMASPIEGDVYYIGVEMLCPCDVGGV